MLCETIQSLQELHISKLPQNMLSQIAPLLIAEAQRKRAAMEKEREKTRLKFIEMSKPKFEQLNLF